MELLWKKLSIFKASVKCKRLSVLPWVSTAFFPVTVIRLAGDISPSKLYTHLYDQPHGLFQEVLDTRCFALQSRASAFNH